MKIGFYGNANNYPFMLARAVQRLGHEVVFLVGSRERLNRPEHLYSDVSVPYPSWIVDVSHRFRWHCLVPGLGRRRVLDLLNSCDAVILNEEGPALAPDLRVPHGVILTGSDIEIFANPVLAGTLKPQAFSRPQWASALSRRALPTSVILNRLVTPQRAGIKTARFVAFLPRGLVPTSDRLLADIGVAPARRLDMQCTDCDLVAYVAPARNPVVRLFSAARFTWRDEPGAGLTSLDLKGTDILLHGLAQFRRQSPERLDLHLVKKGRHIRETIQLATELGLMDQITWHEEMNQREILHQFQQADIVLDQFGQSVVGMAGLDAMATGRPLIANGRPEIFEPRTGQRSPILQATTPAEICSHLQALVPSATLREEIGRKSRAYIEEFFSSDTAARRCLQFFAPSGSRRP